MRIAIVATALAVVAATSDIARADDGPTDAPDRRPYRSTMMLADVASTAVFASGLALAVASRDCDCEEMGSGYLMFIGGGMYIGVGPALHEGKRRRGRTVLSAAMRVVLPIAGGIVGAVVDDEPSTTVALVAAGAATAMALDWTVLAW